MQPTNALAAQPQPMNLVDQTGNSLGTKSNPLYLSLTSALNASSVAPYADGVMLPGVPVMVTIAVPDGATGNIDSTVGAKFEVLRAWLQKRGGDSGSNANTMQVLKNGTAVTEALSINGTVNKTTVDWATIDVAQSVFNVGDTLRVTRTKAGGNVQCLVCLLAVIRA